MAKTLTIELPDELEHKLEARATQQNISMEAMILEWLIILAQPVENPEVDPIGPLLGTLIAEVNDIGANHDFYLGNALKQELNRAE